MINTDFCLLTAAQQGLSQHRDSAIESSRYRRGSRGGEMGEFSPPLFLSLPDDGTITFWAVNIVEDISG